MRPKVKLLYLIAALLVLLFGSLFWTARHPGFVAKVFLQRYRTHALSNTSGSGWSEKRIDRFRVRYQAQDVGAAEVLAALPRAHARVQTAFATLPDQVYLLVFPDRATAKSGFGYDFPDGFNGAGMGGEMLVMVSPAAWSAEERATKPIDKMVTHELTHVAVFHIGGQSVPHWLTEGLAEHVADQISSAAQRRFAQQAASGTQYSLQGLDDLFEGLESLADVGAGFELAGSVVRFMVERYSFGAVEQVLVKLGAGRSLDQALAAAIGTDVKGLEHSWNESLVAAGGQP